MKLIPVVILVSLFASQLSSLAQAEDITLENVPPVVVKTIPESGADDVDPKLTEIKVKFGNFKDSDGRSAVPYLLVFRTAK
ncbi:MAG TPA: hypothetical protein PLY87_14080 [Planctomycetaceae bacterium]|nr:hypothetical protein [Planctomycetaceae bacterium]HQZ66211.1 hypothetical protein [Planctomycetaceae bacterium]